MNDSHRKIMNDLSLTYKDGYTYKQYDFNGMDVSEKVKLLNDVKYLAEKGFVRTNHTIGYVLITLTAHGIDFIDDELSE